VQAYSEALAAKPHCLVITKLDLLSPETPLPAVDAAAAWGSFAVSAATRSGLEVLLEALWARVQQEVRADAEAEAGAE
jgi:GTP-binding protein